MKTIYHYIIVYMDRKDQKVYNRLVEDECIASAYQNFYEAAENNHENYVILNIFPYTYNA